MSIQRKILLYFSVVTIALTGLAHGFIFTLLSEYREEEFQQRQKEKITTTLRFLTEIKEVELQMIEDMDRLTINDLYDEKLLIFDKDKALIYSSIDDTPVPFSGDLLVELSPEKQWIEEKDGLYDVVGVYIKGTESAYYAISKAYDYFGYSKLNYLRMVLTTTFAGITVIVIFLSYFLSRKITRSITDVTQRIKDYDFDKSLAPIYVGAANDEVGILVRRFNELMNRVKDAFAFQKHAINHISHELKTPISVLVSNFERIEKVNDLASVKEMIAHQKEDTKSLGEIINALLDISKAESGDFVRQDKVRIDELMFDAVAELALLHPEFQFHLDFEGVEGDFNLMVSANSRLLKSALTNLMANCIRYSDNNMARIIITASPDQLTIHFENSGPAVEEKELTFLFQHFFRGRNSTGKRGFGLGLVFIHRIIQLHGGEVTYASVDNNSNRFSITLPLS